MIDDKPQNIISQTSIALISQNKYQMQTKSQKKSQYNMKTTLFFLSISSVYC